MKAVQFATPGTSLETAERDIPEVPRGHVLVKAAASGICHSDSMPAAGMASSYPRIPCWICVDDNNETARAAVAAGGQVLMPCG
jgi:D-arabinose 1-dehydrogenase-like Zn-dependent alcohol dehydrogenase